MKNYIQPGDDLTIPSPAAVVSGQGVLAGDLFGVASFDALAGEELVISTVGVFSMPKLSAQAWTVGAKIYWDNTARLMTTVAASNKIVGHAVAAAANPSPTGIVRLDGVAR